MRIPWVIDNRAHRLSDVLNELLSAHKGRSLDVATAYFTVGGFDLVRSGLAGLGSFRLLLGAEPRSGEEIGLRPGSDAVRGLLRRDLEDLPFDESTLRLVEDLIAYLERPATAVRLYESGFLHAKAYLFYADRSENRWERFLPVAGIVGSSNFTRPGLTTNKELNLAHKTVLSDEEAADDLKTPPWTTSEDVREPESGWDVEGMRRVKSSVGARAIAELDAWYEAQWQEARDYKADLVALLDASKYGRTEYTPWQIYLKALYEYLREELDADDPATTRSAVELAEFQEDAVKKARRILARYDGVLIADSVGLGKTWIGKKLLEDFGYHLRQKVLVVAPAALRDMWTRELHSATVAAQILSQEELGREEFDPGPFRDVDVVLVDESHNFRNPAAQRYLNLEEILGGNGGRGRDGLRKKVILLSATPLNNDLFDLYHQLSLITRGDRAYFSAAGIGDLLRYFRQARRDSRNGGSSVALFNLLEEVVIRRTRSFIRAAYPEATINGKRVHFPERRLRTVRYDLEKTYSGIYDQIFAGIDGLRLAPYRLEAYKKAGVAVNDFEAGREQALVGIFKSRYLKRFESSVAAFRLSLRRALAFLKTFESFLMQGTLLKAADFHKAVSFLGDGDDDDGSPRSRAEAIEESEEARRVLEGAPRVEIAAFDLRKLHDDVQRDIEVLTELWYRVKDLGPAQDAKLQRLKDLLRKDLRGQKVLVFTYFRDTARYLYSQLADPENPDAAAFRAEVGGVNIRKLDSGADARERLRAVEAFAPIANGRPELAGTPEEIQVLISTDVLSEGQNLQDCGHLVNYDLHWNPTRMVQRAGRIDRIGSEFEALEIANMFPDEGLERLLGLVQSLSEKIASIDNAGLLDASVLGEVVHPRTFNTLRRILEEDGSVVVEEEKLSELASSEALLRELRSVLAAGGQAAIEELPDGIHSGLAGTGKSGVFFYFEARSRDGKPARFWRFLEPDGGATVDNRHLIASLIACRPDTPRIVDPAVFGKVFELHERAIEEILRDVSAQEALAQAPRPLDPIQVAAGATLQSLLSHPAVPRGAAVETIRFLNAPMTGAQVKAVKKLLKEYQRLGDAETFASALGGLRATEGRAAGTAGTPSRNPTISISRDDLRLICFEVLSR